MQTETMVSARPSTHQDHLATEQFCREFDLADMLTSAPVAGPPAILKAVVPIPIPAVEPEPEPAPKSGTISSQPICDLNAI
jgi:hypothetical protein